MARVTVKQEEFARRIKERFPNEEFKILEYYSSGTPLRVQCCQCNDIIEVSRATNFLVKTKAYGCKNCHGLWKERERKIQEIEKLYDIIDRKVYKTHTYYTIKCKKCGHERTSDLGNLYKHFHCGCETGTLRNRTAEEFLAEANKNVLCGSYTLVSPYKNQTEKVLLKHSCGFVWSVRPGDVIRGKAFCPRCTTKRSKGEILVAEILTNLNIDYQEQWLVPNTRLRYDFFFILNNEKYVIEYNGKQHYAEVPFFSSANLQEQQERDKRKRQYCLDNNIHFIEIPYWLKKEEILNLISSTTSLYDVEDKCPRNDDSPTKENDIV